MELGRNGVADAAWNDEEPHFQANDKCVGGVVVCLFLQLPPVLILEIFKHLDARELSIVSCVCSLFRLLASDSHGWKDFYCERWGMPTQADGFAIQGSQRSWRELYVAREARCKALLGKFRMDILPGHTATVRCVRMLPTSNLLVSAGYDSVVRLWDLEEGMPVAWSRPAGGGTMRAIAADKEMLAVAGSDCVVRVWRSTSGYPHVFDLSRVAGGSAETCLYGHLGPVSCLDMDSCNLYSGSWDMTVKVWSRTRLSNMMSLGHWDWVWALVARGHRLLSTAGNDAYVWDSETGQLLRVRRGIHNGQVYCVEGNRTGVYMITGGEDGAVRVFDNRISPSVNDVDEAVAAWIPHTGAVFALAFDDPWLVSASADGTLGMMDLRHVMRRKGMMMKWKHQHCSSSYVVKDGNTVQRMLKSGSECTYSVDIGSDRVVSGGDEKTIRVWDFSQALESERRAQACRSIRVDQRMRRKQISLAAQEARAISCNIKGT